MRNNFFKFKILLKVLIFSLFLLFISISVFSNSIPEVKAIGSYGDPNKFLLNDDFQRTSDTSSFAYRNPFVKKSNLKFYGYVHTSEQIDFKIIYQDLTITNYLDSYITVKDCLVTPDQNGYWECNVVLPKNQQEYYANLYSTPTNLNNLLSGYTFEYDSIPPNNVFSFNFIQIDTVQNKESEYIRLNTTKFGNDINVPSGKLKIYYQNEQICDSGIIYFFPEFANIDFLSANTFSGNCKLPDEKLFCIKDGIFEVTFEDIFGNVGGVQKLNFSNNAFYSNSCKFPSAKNALYRFWNDGFKGHFYTSSLDERNKLLNLYYGNPTDWKYEGIAYGISDCTDASSSQVYRFWSAQNKHHFYTNSPTERDQVINQYSDNEWLYEGPAFCAYAFGGPDMTPVYRFWSEQNHVHFYTASEQEKNDTVAKYTDKEWHLEGVAYFVKK